LIEEAEKISKENEASHLCMWARAILAVEGENPRAPEFVQQAFGRAASTGILDPLVFARRLLPALADFGEATPLVDELFSAVHSAGCKVASTGGAADPFPTDQLTRRETEVLALLTQSKSNKEIASVLFLSEATVKVHVRHILRKLGARSRTEVAVKAVRMQQLRGLADTTQE
jgi:DNA-binding CsgD family transcriptional regulator